MTISDQLPTSPGGTTRMQAHPHHEAHATHAGKHEFHKQTSLEDVLGEDREKRRSVSELVGEEFRQPFTLHVRACTRAHAARASRRHSLPRACSFGPSPPALSHAHAPRSSPARRACTPQERDEVDTSAKAVTAKDVAQAGRAQVAHDHHMAQREASKGFLHASPAGVAPLNAHIAQYAEASTVGAGGHATQKFPAQHDKVEKAAAAQGGAARRVRSASLEAAEIAKHMEMDQLREAQKNYALHAEIEAAKR